MTQPSPRDHAEHLATADLIAREKSQILDIWMHQQLAAIGERRATLHDAELRSQSERFLDQFVQAIRTGNFTDVSAPEFEPIVTALRDVSRTRSHQGFTPTETAAFVFSLKEALLPVMTASLSGEPVTLLREVLAVNRLLDQLGLVTYDTYVKGREAVITQQAADLLEASTPVIEVWDGILAVPLIGTLDSGRTQVVMETLLSRIISTRARVAIIDITGVPTVDTLVAQHLLKTVAAIRPLGADSVTTGISAPIAQTMVHLGIDLSRVVTRASMADGIRYALGRQATAGDKG